jgi:hypothetical protein
MKIVAIFDTRLFSFRFPGEEENELNRLLNLWNDPQYVFQFIRANITDAPQNISTLQLTNLISDDGNEIDDLLSKLGKDLKGNFEVFFKQLNNNEYQSKTLSKRKGRKNYLRLYALKIDTNCFVITGGAIKFTHLMEDRKHTKTELQKMETCRQFLKSQGIYDEESLYEYIKEEL